VASYAFEHRNAVFQATAIANDAAKSIVAVRDRSKANPNEVFRAESDGGGVYVLNGRQVYLYSNKIKEIDGQLTPAKPLTNLWADIAYNGISKEGGVTLKNGKNRKNYCVELSRSAQKRVILSWISSLEAERLRQWLISWVANGLRLSSWTI
jgi:adenine-specific DNA-methyltransferase